MLSILESDYLSGSSHGTKATCIIGVSIKGDVYYSLCLYYYVSIMWGGYIWGDPKALKAMIIGSVYYRGYIIGMSLGGVYYRCIL